MRRFLMTLDFLSTKDTLDNHCANILQMKRTASIWDMMRASSSNETLNSDASDPQAQGTQLHFEMAKEESDIYSFPVL